MKSELHIHSTSLNIHTLSFKVLLTTQAQVLLQPQAMTGLKIVLLFLASVFHPIVANANNSESYKSPPVPAPGSYAPESASPIPAPISPSPSPYIPMLAPEPSSSGIKGGFWPSWLAERNPPSTIPTSYFTHLFYAFLVPDATTYELAITWPDEQWMSNFTATLHAKNPPAKAFLSIGGGNAGPYTFSNMASNPSNRASFIKSTIEVARNYSFDGLDLDWEFPMTQQDMSNLSTLFAEWRTAVQNEALSSGRPRLLLSAAVYFASDFFLPDDVPRTYPVDAIRNFVDFVNPMCFNYHGSWDTSVTGEHALLYDETSNVSTSYGIQSWIKAGVPAKKLVMGLPLYGRTWQLKDPSVHGIGAPAVGTGPGNGGIILYTDLVDFNVENNATEVYDEKTVSMYSYAGTNWIGYDGAGSIKSKIQFAQAHGLGGYFFWVLGYDKNWTLSQQASMAWDNKN